MASPPDASVSARALAAGAKRRSGHDWFSPLVLRLTIRNTRGENQSWPLRLLAPAANALALTEASGGEAIWVLAATDAAKIAAGVYRISVTLDTSASAAARAWKGVATSRISSVTFSA